MSRTLSLITIVAIAFAGFASAAPAQVANPSFELAKRDKSFKGTGTFFHPATEGGSTGACGPDEGDNSDIVALNAPQYGDMGSKSKWCGKKITIKGPAGTATAKVNDACPECKSGDLDLTPSLFKKIVGDEDIGVGDITWSLS